MAVKPCMEWKKRKKERKHEVGFLDADKQTFVQVDTINIGEYG